MYIHNLIYNFMRNLDEQNVRKIFKLHKSYSVTLPINQIRGLKWREGQKVVIKQKGDQLIISDWKE